MTESRSRRPPRSVLWRLRRVLHLLVLSAVLASSWVAWDFFESVELPPEEPTLETTFICAADVVPGECGRENSLAQLSLGEDRVSVDYEQIPEELVAAVVAIEDRQFFDHSGIDPVGVARAAYTNLREGDVRQGGSSITQQYVKNAFLSSERTVTRKLREAVLAIKIERELEKEEILERYLNTIYFGRGAYGVQAASRAYFGLDLEDLNLAHTSYLAGLIQSPEEYDANRGDDELAASQRAAATARRSAVLQAMLIEGFVSEEQVDQVEAIPLELYVTPRDERGNFGVVRHREHATEYYVEFVLQELRTRAGLSDEDLFGGGLRIYTTLDYEMQRSAYEAVAAELDPARDDPAGAVVTVDDNGRIMAMVGGRDYRESQVNLATGVQGGGTGRQPGSAFKPFVLATALEEGISAESLFESKPEVLIPGANAGEPWIVRNHELADDGVLNLIEATQYSSNTVYAQLMTEVGAADVVETARRAGIRSELLEVNALVLGAGEVSVLDMASAYSTFMREGVRIDPFTVWRVETSDGRPLAGLNLSAESSEQLDQLDAQTVRWAMAQVVQAGTGSGANFGREVAGKTGTTEEYRDAWFVGFSCKLTTAVWVGYDEANPDGTPRLMNDVRGDEVTGGSIPTDIWRRHMAEATARYEPCAIWEPWTYEGEVLNPELATTTTTTTIPLPCPEGWYRPAPDPDPEPESPEDPGDGGGGDIVGQDDDVGEEAEPEPAIPEGCRPVVTTTAPETTTSTTSTTVPPDTTVPDTTVPVTTVPDTTVPGSTTSTVPATTTSVPATTVPDPSTSTTTSVP